MTLLLFNTELILSFFWGYPNLFVQVLINGGTWRGLVWSTAVVVSCIWAAIVKFVKYSQDHPLTRRVTGGLTQFPKLERC